MEEHKSIPKWIDSMSMRGHFFFTKNDLCSAFPDKSSNAITRTITRLIAKNTVVFRFIVVFQSNLVLVPCAIYQPQRPKNQPKFTKNLTNSFTATIIFRHNKQTNTFNICLLIFYHKLTKVNNHHNYAKFLYISQHKYFYHIFFNYARCR